MTYWTRSRLISGRPSRRRCISARRRSIRTCRACARTTTWISRVLGVDAPPAIWIGNRTVASCHYDAPNNIACVAVGRRRFTMFPPEPDRQSVSGAARSQAGWTGREHGRLRESGLQSFPRFKDALAAGYSALLEPGDAIFIPSMWWHHVEALSAFNMLVNYWWSTSPKHVPDSNERSLYHAIWSMRDRPEAEKDAWRQVFRVLRVRPVFACGRTSARTGARRFGTHR